MTRPPAPKGILLDLDDTLYPEREYFLSGVAAVAAWLAERAGGDHLSALNADIAMYGRQGVLDRIAPPAGVCVEDGTAWRESLLLIYRNHTPTLFLFEDVMAFLNQCRRRGCRIGLVTDGKSCVQWRKIRALCLDRLLDVIVVTEDIDAPKPSSRPFRVAAQHLGLPATDCTYIADDASKDFIGPRQLGMSTIQLQRKLDWPLAKPSSNPGAEAHYQTQSLVEAAQLLFGDAA